MDYLRLQIMSGMTCQSVTASYAKTIFHVVYIKQTKEYLKKKIYIKQI